MNYNKCKEQLKKGRNVLARPHGNSMKPRIKSGQRIIISPKIDSLEKKDIVFCKVKGRYYVHLISAIRAEGEEFQISNNKGHINGWTKKKNIFGKVIKILKDNEEWTIKD